MRREITTIIFSKNRPCQLELLLRSLNLDNLNVIYTSDGYFEKGYEIVKKEYPLVNFVKQGDFKEDVLSLLGDYTMFLCDDDVMIGDFNINCIEFDEFVNNEDIICLNLRMSRDYDYDFLKNRKVAIPEFDEGKWEWSKCKGDWRCPMSATSQIYRAEDISPTLERYNFHCPNSMEILLKTHKPKKALMIGFKKGKIINIPANQVQDKFINKNGGVSIEELNDKFLSGLRIDLESIKKIKTRSYFLLTEYKWT